MRSGNLNERVLPELREANLSLHTLFLSISRQRQAGLLPWNNKPHVCAYVAVGIYKDVNERTRVCVMNSEPITASQVDSNPCAYKIGKENSNKRYLSIVYCYGKHTHAHHPTDKWCVRKDEDVWRLDVALRMTNGRWRSSGCTVNRSWAFELLLCIFTHEYFLPTTGTQKRGKHRHGMGTKNTVCQTSNHTWHFNGTGR